MSRGYKNFQSWRKRVKLRLVEAFGGACGVCGYNRCLRNLVFHHLDPDQKDFAITSKKRGGWLSIVTEAKKCVMLCANCHGEVHDGIVILPVDCKRFDEAFTAYGTWTPESNRRKVRPCKSCGQMISQRGNKNYCSQACCGRDHRGPKKAAGINTAADVINLLEQFKFKWDPAARSIGITGNSLRKLAAVRGLPTTKLSRTFGDEN